MNDSLWTFLFEIANFVGLAAVLAWLFFKPVRKAIEDQRAAFSQKDEEATQKLMDAEHLRQDIESQHQRLATELETMRTNVSEAAKQDAEQIIVEARVQMEREQSRMKREALHIERAQTAKIAHAVAVVTHNTVKRFLQQLDGPELEQTLVKAACRELHMFSNSSLSPVNVESAMTLDEASRQLIETSLGTAAKSANFRVVPELQGGLRISTARGLIDVSITGLANFAKQSLSADMESMIREESESE